MDISVLVSLLGIIVLVLILIESRFVVEKATVKVRRKK
jgi:hypothetical protein